jgi:hypothetical protein
LTWNTPSGPTQRAVSLRQSGGATTSSSPDDPPPLEALYIRGATMCKTLFMNMLTSTLYFQLGIFYALTLITTPAHATSHLSTLLTTRTVTNTSKAGLAWPNGNSVNIEQYTSTGKVSWCVDTEFPECRSNIFRIQVLHLVNFPRESQYRIYPYVLGREVHRPMDIDGFQNPSKFRTNHNGCFGDE